MRTLLGLIAVGLQRPACASAHHRSRCSAEEPALRKLSVERDVPVHGAIEPFSQMVATIKSKGK